MNVQPHARNLQGKYLGISKGFLESVAHEVRLTFGSTWLRRSWTLILLYCAFIVVDIGRLSEQIDVNLSKVVAERVCVFTRSC